jgi:hypothetical protein|tara:strand:- start:1291 stop:1431 length:141 start_codon:yes stop_codon:yes gene_type:complete
MLFTFNKFWKTLLILISSWLIYGLWGFELTIVTLLALILTNKVINE